MASSSWLIYCLGPQSRQQTQAKMMVVCSSGLRNRSTLQLQTVFPEDLQYFGEARECECFQGYILHTRLSSTAVLMMDAIKMPNSTCTVKAPCRTFIVCSTFVGSSYMQNLFSLKYVVRPGSSQSPTLTSDANLFPLDGAPHSGELAWTLQPRT